MRMTLDKADKVFSIYTRRRDGMCTRCGSNVQFNQKGLPISHQASHFWGRGKENTRFDEMNVTTHCGGCHMYLTAQPEEHRQWKLDQIGQEEYDKLMLRANTYCKKDRDMAYLYWKGRLKEDFGIVVS